MIKVNEFNTIKKGNGEEVLLVCRKDGQVDRYVLNANANPHQQKMFLKIPYNGYSSAFHYNVNEFDGEGKNWEELLTKGKVVNEKQY